MLQAISELSLARAFPGNSELQTILSAGIEREQMFIGHIFLRGLLLGFRGSPLGAEGMCKPCGRCADVCQQQLTTNQVTQQGPGKLEAFSPGKPRTEYQS